MTSQQPPSLRPTARDDSATSRATDDLDEKPPGLSVTQVVASALAAVSSTVLLSYLGVAGTIIGAGIASVLTIVGNNIYTRSILKTRRQMKAALQAGVVMPVGKNGRKVLLPTLAGSRASGDDRSGGADDGTVGGADATRDDGVTSESTAVLPAIGGTGGLADTAVLGSDDLAGTRLADLHTAAGTHTGDGPDGATDLPEDGDASGDEAAGDEAADDSTGTTRQARAAEPPDPGPVDHRDVRRAPRGRDPRGGGRRATLSEILRGNEGTGTTISHVVAREPASTGNGGSVPDDTSTDAPSTGTTRARPRRDRARTGADGAPTTGPVEPTPSPPHRRRPDSGHGHGRHRHRRNGRRLGLRRHRPRDPSRHGQRDRRGQRLEHRVRGRRPDLLSGPRSAAPCASPGHRLGLTPAPHELRARPSRPRPRTARPPAGSARPPRRRPARGRRSGEVQGSRRVEDVQDESDPPWFSGTSPQASRR
ncbi:hypothetical protein NKG05_14580 [Oerskovia sp. M15]